MKKILAVALLVTFAASNSLLCRSGRAAASSTQEPPDTNYLAGDWDGDRIATLAVRRRGNVILRTNNWSSGITEPEFAFGASDVTQYLVGNWDGDGKDTLAVRAGNRILRTNDW